MCFNGIVYARTDGKQELTFQVSGMLWQRSLVMRDLESGTLWSHLMGKAMEGDLKGTQLEMLPAVMTTWREWRERHPETSVLAMTRTARGFDEEVWDHPERFLFGVPLGAGRDGPAVSLPKLMNVHVLNLEALGEPVVVTFADAGKRAQAFDPRVEGKRLRFEPAAAGRMMAADGSVWDAVTGECLAGELKGRNLRPRAGLISCRRAWRVFHPEGALVE